MSHPSTVEEFAEHLEFLGALEGSKAQYDQQYDHVTAHYDLLEDYKIQAPALQLAKYATMEGDYATLREAQWQAETAREALVARFRGDLDSQAGSSPCVGLSGRDPRARPGYGHVPKSWIRFILVMNWPKNNVLDGEAGNSALACID